MSFEILVNEPAQAERDVPVFLTAPDGTPTTDLTGVTFTYRKPGGSTDAAVTPVSDTAGRFRLPLASGDVDTIGIGWITVTVVASDSTTATKCYPVRIRTSLNSLARNVIKLMLVG